MKQNKKAIEIAWTKLIVILIIIITIIILSTNLFTTKKFYSTQMFSVNQNSYNTDCELSKINCEKKITNCDNIKEGQSECSIEEKNKWEAYKNLEKECWNKELCNEKELEAWVQYTQNYVYKKLEEEIENPNENSDIVPGDPNSLVNYPINKYRDLSVDNLNKFFDNKGHPELKVYSQTFIDSAKKYDIDPYYFVSHFVLETGWGTSRIWKDKYNGFGIGAYDNCAYDCALKFDNPQQGIEKAAEWISTNYLHGTDYRKSSTLNEMNKYYATDDEWKYKIASNMEYLDNIG